MENWIWVQSVLPIEGLKKYFCCYFVIILELKIVFVTMVKKNFPQELSPNLMNLSRVSNPPKSGLNWGPLKSWNIEYNFK